MNNKRYLIFPCLFLAACWVFFFCIYPYHLHFKEQMNLFTADWLPYFQKPAFLTEWLGDYATQFFLLTGGGSTILTIVLAILWAGLFFAFKRMGFAKNAALVALLPVAAEAALACHLEYPLSMAIGAAIAVWVFIAISFIKNKNMFACVAIVFSVVLYLLAGAHFFLFILLVLIQQIRRKNFWLFPALTFIFAIATPLIAGRFFYLTFSQSFFYPIIEHYLFQQPFCFLLTEISVLVALLLVRYKVKRMFLCGITVIVAAVEVCLYSNFREEYNLGLSSEAYFGNWEKVKTMSNKAKYNTYLSSYYGNLVSAREGKLADELLTHYQAAHLGMFLAISETSSYINLMSAPDVLMQCGDMAQAQHSAMLSMLFTPHQCPSRMVRKLAEIAIINGEYSIAEKYLNILSKTTLHRKWANENKQLIASDTAKFAFSGKRAVLSQKDTLVSPNDWRNTLINLLESNPQNKTAADYLLCYHLLRKDLELFKADYDSYYYETFGYTPSEIYQEAILLVLNKNDRQQYTDELKKYRISSNVWKLSQEFLSLLENRQQNEEKIRSTFVNSYWFYYFYAQIR